MLAFESFDRAAVTADVASWRQRLTTEPELAPLLHLWLAWAQQMLAQPVLPTSWSGRVVVVSIGGARIVTLPGEPFLTAADTLRALRGSQQGPTLVLGYSDGVPGYLPPRDEYQHGGYEVVDAHRYYGMPAPFAAGSLEQLLAAAGQLLLPE
ncbi:hypothetical protein ACQCX5_14620 [Propionibacteriaceae bacterium G57]|uniref:hypothetical protein n=1 Tax=Aestuariimicrobium sp. G57 TaxID=3418485 RepID=UPI003DA77393